MQYVIYRIRVKATGEYYYGRTSLANWDAGYCGGGVKISAIVDRQGKASIEREVIYKVKGEGRARALERTVIGTLWLDDPRCLNMQSGG